MNVEPLRKAGDALFGKVYELSLVKTYVSRWTHIHAIRELIQNALDSESPFVYEFRREADAWTLLLNSEFATLTPQTLLLGASSKAGDEDSIGSFGEGYKLALLVLTREGYPVEIRNGDLLWRPRFRHSRTFGAEILAIEETVAADKLNRGVTYVVGGLDDAAVAEIRDSCLRMQEDIGAIKSTQFGDILLDRPGKLYVGSLFVCATELHFGYNIKPAYLRLERDRQTVFSWDLKSLTVKCWFATGETERVANMIAEEVVDVEYAKYDAPELVKEECYRIFRRRNPDGIIADSPEAARKAVEAGLTRTVYIGSTFGSVVASAPSYVAEPSYSVRVVPPHVALAAFLSAHRDEMRRPAIVAFKRLIAEAEEKWELK